MLRGIPSLSKNLWYMAYLGLFILLMQSARGAVDGFDDHRWFNGALGVYWSGFIIFLMAARYPNGLRKFPIVEPAPLARRESRGR
jgi:hypothetical protein